ncbi:MAG: hypothetical protein ACRDAO_04265 [Culicoidibacterales bacterium]
MHTYQLVIEIHFQVGEAKLNYTFEAPEDARETQLQQFNQQVIEQARKGIQEVLLSNSLQLNPQETGAPLFVIIRLDGESFFKFFFADAMTEAPLIWSDGDLNLEYYSMQERQKLS